MTPKQKEALELGHAIRNVVCIDSLANAVFEPDLRERIREVCDEQMHRLGRESISEQRKRIHYAIIHNFKPDYKYQKREEPNA